MNELLAGLERLLAEHAGALRAGDADALPALAQPLREQLALVTRHARAIGSADRSRLAALVRLCHESEAMLHKRLHATQRTLQALADAAPGGGAHRTGVYGPQGLLAPAHRGRGFAAA